MRSTWSFLRRSSVANVLDESHGLRARLIVPTTSVAVLMIVERNEFQNASTSSDGELTASDLFYVITLSMSTSSETSDIERIG